MRFEVWAPRPAWVEVEVDGVRRPMHRDDGGWWRADLDAGVGSRYGFALDGGPPRPDPRSVDQPDGAEGLSAVYDHGAHAWSDDGWAGIVRPGAVVYELHVGTFTPEGTFDAVVAKLPHLVELGVDVVELLPVATGSGDRGWGYDGSHLFAPHPAYGGPDGLKRLVDAAHAHGLGVLVDVVYNHLGPVGNHLAEFGPYFTDRHHTAWGDAVAVEHPEVRRLLVDNVRSWVEDFHADGLRLDAVHAIVDHSPRHVLAELADAAHDAGRRHGRRVLVVAESEDNDPTLVRRAPEGYGLDAVWSDDWHHALHTVLTGEHDGYYGDFGDPAHLVTALEGAWVYVGQWSPALGRARGTPPLGVPATAFVVSTQTHDQVGNRALGDRLGSLTTWGRLHVAAALLLTSPFTPMLFQGEEWGASTPFQYFSDHRDPILADAVRAGRRAEFAAFGWDPDALPDPQDPATLRRSVLLWAEVTAAPHAALLRWYRKLLALRRAEPDLHDHTVRARATWECGRLTVGRGAITVLANLSGEHWSAEIEGHVLLESDPSVRARAGDRAGRTVVDLPVDSVTILRSPDATPVP